MEHLHDPELSQIMFVVLNLQMNVVSNVIDAGFVYGSDEATARGLRTFQGGELRVQRTPDFRDFPPNSDQVQLDCQNPPQEQVCYVAGS